MTIRRSPRSSSGRWRETRTSRRRRRVSSRRRQMSIEARSAFFPNIDLGSRAERSKFRYRGPGGGANIANDFSVPVDFGYELDVWGKVRRQVEGAVATEQAVQETLNAMRLSVAGEVAQTYWALHAVDADREVLAKTLEIRRKALDLLGKRREAGTISGLDLSRAETEVSTAEADRIRLDQDRVQLVNALAVLSGSVATGSHVSERPQLPKPPFIPVSVPSELLRQRPDIRAAERRVAAANADIGVATAAFYPSFTINASSGLDSGSLANLFKASVARLVARRERDRARHRPEMAQGASAPPPWPRTKPPARNTARRCSTRSARWRTRCREPPSSSAAKPPRTRRSPPPARPLTFPSNASTPGLVSFLDVVDAERTRLAAERDVECHPRRTPRALRLPHQGPRRPMEIIAARPFPYRTMSSAPTLMRPLIALTAVPVLLASCDKKPAAAEAAAAANPMDRVQPVEVMPVTVKTLRETVGLVGSIAANESAELRPEIPGVIESIHFEEGSTAKKGELLAKIDTRELEAQLAETRASFALAEKNLERNQSLLADQAVSKLEVDAAVAEHAKLKAAIDLLEVRIAKSSVVAPFDGVTGARSVSVGDFVTSQSDHHHRGRSLAHEG